MNLIIGAGITGCVLAEHIARELQEEILIIDKRSHIAGNVFDEKIENIWIHHYGPHIFHTNDESIWKYVNQFATFHPYIHKVRAIIDGIEVPLPFSLLSMETLLPQEPCNFYIQELSKHFAYGERMSIFELEKIETLKPLAHFIYEKIFKNYSTKQWGIQAGLQELDPSVAKRVPFVFGKSDCYFDDRFQGIPLEGYTKLCENMINHPKIKLKLQTTHKDLNLNNFKRVFYCGGIDEFFDFKFGALQYRGVKFEFQTYEMPQFQSNSVINYPNNYDFTRITEYKHFLPTPSSKTIISKEYPMEYISHKSEQCYPIPNAKQREIYAKYLDYAKGFENLYFCGRLGTYQYLDMDDAIAEVMKLFNSIKEQSK